LLTAVFFPFKATVKYTALLFAVSTALAQAPSDIERRLNELEEKMRLLDPAFGKETAARDILSRLDELDKKLTTLLAGKEAPPAPAPVQTASAQPLQPISVAGDFQTARDGETRLPVAGYMDFHVNKESGDSFRPDFHRFVLLFGHSFSNRIKFW